MTRTVLITGGAGFLGRAVVREYQRRGWHTTGIGHSTWTAESAAEAGYSSWQRGDIDLATLSRLGGEFDVVVHCAANGSVPYSLTHPLDAFRRTVQTTAEVLDFCRSFRRHSRVIYPSSAAVYGAANDEALSESSPSNPVSPYGYHKRMAEDLLECAARHGWTRCAAIRFFSIYGPGLNKQLLWDAANKLSRATDKVTFWGTGEETRDWIHVDDAAALMADLSDIEAPFTILNGAAGERVTVRTVLEMLKNALGVDVEIEFSGAVKPGDPRYYHADVSRARQLGAPPSVKLADGLRGYAQWFQSIDTSIS